MSKVGVPVVELQAGRLVDAGGDRARLYPADADVAGRTDGSERLVPVWGYQVGQRGMAPMIIGCVELVAAREGEPVYRDRHGAEVEVVG